jgi:ABC-type branched-subunit amino acid transport system ATPase component
VFLAVYESSRLLRTAQPPKEPHCSASHTCVLGNPAGIGKSTLLGLISGTLEPVKGHITRNPKVGRACGLLTCSHTCRVSRGWCVWQHLLTSCCLLTLEPVIIAHASCFPRAHLLR